MHGSGPVDALRPVHPDDDVRVVAHHVIGALDRVGQLDAGEHHAACARAWPGAPRPRARRPIGKAASAGAISSSRITASMARNVPPAQALHRVTKTCNGSTPSEVILDSSGRNDLRGAKR